MVEAVARRKAKLQKGPTLAEKRAALLAAPVVADSDSDDDGQAPGPAVAPVPAPTRDPDMPTPFGLDTLLPAPSRGGRMEVTVTDSAAASASSTDSSNPNRPTDEFTDGTAPQSRSLVPHALKKKRDKLASQQVPLPGAHRHQQAPSISAVARPNYPCLHPCETHLNSCISLCTMPATHYTYALVFRRLPPQSLRRLRTTATLSSRCQLPPQRGLMQLQTLGHRLTRCLRLALRGIQQRPRRIRRILRLPRRSSQLLVGRAKPSSATAGPLWQSPTARSVQRLHPERGIGISRSNRR